MSVIQSCTLGINKIVECLQQKLPAIPKCQLRNKVREISDFTDNRWQVGLCFGILIIFIRTLMLLFDMHREHIMIWLLLQNVWCCRAWSEHCSAYTLQCVVTPGFLKNKTNKEINLIINEDSKD